MKTRFVAIIGALVVLYLLAGMALAMSSANYRLDWFTPLTSGGGGSASSTNYAVNLTMGQAAIGGSSSANYTAGLGYWYGYGVEQSFQVYLPVVIKN